MARPSNGVQGIASAAVTNPAMEWQVLSSERMLSDAYSSFLSEVVITAAVTNLAMM